MINSAEFDYHPASDTVLVHFYSGLEYVSMLDCPFQSFICFENTNLCTFWVRAIIGSTYFSLSITESLFNELNEKTAEILTLKASQLSTEIVDNSQ